MEPAALWKQWKIKLQRRFFHCSHIAWKTLRKKQKRGEFPTVPTASTAGFNLGRETCERSHNLLRELARNLCWEAQGESGMGLAAKKTQSRSAKAKFFLDSPLS